MRIGPDTSPRDERWSTGQSIVDATGFIVGQLTLGCVVDAQIWMRKRSDRNFFERPTAPTVVLSPGRSRGAPRGPERERKQHAHAEVNAAQ